MGKRMYYILKIIQDTNRKAIKAEEIIKELEQYHIYINIKTVYSCIQRINEFFEEWVKGDMIISIRRTGFVIAKELFFDGELQFLIDSISFHEDLNDEDKYKLKEKLFQFASCHQKDRLIDFIPKEKQIAFSLFTNLSTIIKAIESRQVLGFQYITYEVVDDHLREIPSQNGNLHDRYLISPYQIAVSNNHYYLIGYNEKHKNELTTYRIDRMRLIKTIKQSFVEVREQFDMQDEIAKTTNMYISQKRDTLEIECDRYLLREIASHFKTEIKAEKLHQQRYLIKIEDVPISEGLIGWIFMLQDKIKIVSPISLKKEIVARVNKMQKIY